MERVNEFNLEYRQGKSGIKYLFRGPNIDWGVFRFLPGESLGKHRHEKVEETFYFTKGSGKMIIDDKEFSISVGDAFRIEPGKVHNIINDSNGAIDGVFIKHIYAPKDKIDVE